MQQKLVSEVWEAREVSSLALACVNPEDKGRDRLRLERYYSPLPFPSTIPATGPTRKTKETSRAAQEGAQTITKLVHPLCISYNACPSSCWSCLTAFYTTLG